MSVFSYILRRSTLIVPLVYVLLLLLFQPFTWIDNTCTAAASVWGEPSPHLIYVGYLLSYPMMWGRILFPQIEWFTAIQYLLYLVSITVLAHYTLRHQWQRPGIKHIAGFALILYLTVLLFKRFYFPYVSCVGMASGLLLMLYGSKRGKLSRIVWGCLLLLAGASLRYDSSPLVLLVAGILLNLYAIKKRWHQLGCILLACACGAGVYLLQPLLATVSTWEVSACHPAQNLIEINDARMRFCDYRDDSDMEKASAYEQLNCSKNDLMQLERFDTCLPQRSDSKWWKSMLDLRNRANDKYPRTLKLMWKRIRFWYSQRILTPVMYTLLPLLLLCFPFPRRWDDERIWLFTAYLAAILTLIVIGRVNTTSVIAILYLILPLMLFEMPDRPFKHRASLNVSLVLLCIILTLSVRSLIIPQAVYEWRAGSRFSPLSANYWNPSLTHRIREECARHPDRQYFMPVHLWWRGCMPSSSLLSQSYLEWRNVFPMYCWTYLLPSIHQELHRRGVKSDLTLFFNPNYRYIINTADSFWTTYYESISPHSLLFYIEHYGVQPKMIPELSLGENWWICRIECSNVMEKGPEPMGDTHENAR